MDVVALFFPFRRGFGCIAKPTAAHSPGCKTRVILASPDNCMQTPSFGHGQWYWQVPYFDHPAPMTPHPQMNPPMSGPYPGQWMVPPRANPIAGNVDPADYERHRYGCKPKSAAIPKRKHVTERERQKANRERRAVSGPCRKREKDDQPEIPPVIPAMVTLETLKHDLENIEGTVAPTGVPSIL